MIKKGLATNYTNETRIVSALQRRIFNLRLNKRLFCHPPEARRGGFHSNLRLDLATLDTGTE
jgi:hypothetical protein